MSGLAHLEEIQHDKLQEDYVELLQAVYNMSQKTDEGPCWCPYRDAIETGHIKSCEHVRTVFAKVDNVWLKKLSD